MHERCYVGVGGEKQSGKDTAGAFFQERGFVKVNFADNLKQMLSYAFALPVEIFYSGAVKDKPFSHPIVLTHGNIARINKWIRKTHDFGIQSTKYLGQRLTSPRHMMQFVGAEMIRVEHPHYTQDVTISLMKQHRKAVCCDVRFIEELKGIEDLAEKKSARFASIYIIGRVRGTDYHHTETRLTPDMCERVIYNTKGVSDLHARLEEAFASLICDASVGAR